MYHVSIHGTGYRSASLVAICGVLNADLLSIIPGKTFIPNGTSFINFGGASQTCSTTGGGMDEVEAVLSEPGLQWTLVRHMPPGQRQRVVAAIQRQTHFNSRAGTDPIFPPGGWFELRSRYRCFHRLRALLRRTACCARAILIRIAIACRSRHDYAVTEVKNPMRATEQII